MIQRLLGDGDHRRCRSRGKVPLSSPSHPIYSVKTNILGSIQSIQPDTYFRKSLALNMAGWAKGQNTSHKVTPVGLLRLFGRRLVVADFDASEPFPACQSLP